MTTLAVITPSFSLDRNIPCLRCGYNLRTLSIDARCPECSTPIASTLDANLLRYADPAWTNILSLSMGLMLLSASFEIINAYVMLFVVRFDLPWDLSLFMDPIHTFASPLFWLGVFLFGRAGPRPSSTSRFSARRVMRIAATIALLWAIFNQVIFNNLSTFPDYLTDFPIAHFIELVATIVLYIYLLQLARRAGIPSLRRHTRIAFVLSIVAGCIWAALDLYADADWSDAIDLPARLVVAPIFLYQLYIFFRFQRILRQAAAYARQYWHFCSPIPVGPP